MTPSVNLHGAQIFSGGAGSPSHAPGSQVKGSETAIAYNPFWIDLQQEAPFRLNPEWANLPGIVLNWLLKFDDNGCMKKLILGVEATCSDTRNAKKVDDAAGAMFNFIQRYGAGTQGMTRQDCKKLLNLGHPTLACEIRGGTVAVSSAMERLEGKQGVEGVTSIATAVGAGMNAEDYVLGNYKGILGGELHHGFKFKKMGKAWYINYNSGRYGDQHLTGKRAKANSVDPNMKYAAKQAAKTCFKIYTGEDVID